MHAVTTNWLKRAAGICYAVEYMFSAARQGLGPQPNDCVIFTPIAPRAS